MTSKALTVPVLKKKSNRISAKRIHLIYKVTSADMPLISDIIIQLKI
jgi:hypothetical protein